MDNEDDRSTVDLGQLLAVESGGSGKAVKPEPRGYKGWFFTWNNPTLTGPVMLETLKKMNVKMTKFQLEECPTTKTPHFQGAAQWPNQVRMSTLTKKFPGIYCERLGDWSMVYGTKEETRIGGPWAHGCIVPRKLMTIRREDMYPWQGAAFDRYSKPCDEDRKVDWYWEKEGNVGKTSLLKALRDKLGEGAVLLVNGDHKDMAHAVRQIVKPLKGPQVADLQIVVVDLERMDEVPYDFLGKLKAGWLFSPKYESADLRFAPIHVVCIANFAPDQARISADRWNIIDLNQ